MMDWLRVKIYNWLVPLLAKGINNGINVGLEGLHKKQNDFQQEHRVHMQRLDDWFQECTRQAKASEAQHKEKMERFDRLIEAVFNSEHK